MAQSAPGDPLPGLSAAQLDRFRKGAADFQEIESVEDGLGPAFNGVSCGSCHSLPALGGGGNIRVLRAGTLSGGQFTPPSGGSLIHLFSIPDNKCQPSIPANANVVAQRVATAIFGAGLVEAIPDAAIQALEAAQGRFGVTGRAAWIVDPVSNTRRVGRFGWKAQHATLLAFAADAYVNEMGITNAVFRSEVGAGLTPQQLAACDTVPDPEDKPDPVTGLRAIDRFEHFMKFLAPVGRAPIAADVSRQGEALFNSTGCAACHVPAISTGPNAPSPFTNRSVAAFSDFLLHDVGTGDGIAQGAAQPNEIKTPPLWGLRYRKQLLHDGRALSLADAISAHGAEAHQSKDRYDRLPPQDRQALMAFLNSL